MRIYVDHTPVDEVPWLTPPKAVPESQAALDALLSLPAIGGPVGYSGGVISIGIRLAVVEPRIVAAGFFAGSFVPRTMFEEVSALFSRSCGEVTSSSL